MNAQDYIPEDVVAFWFPDGDAPTADEHMRLWNWRMRGGAHEEVIARFSDLTTRAAAGELDHWADTPMGRLALILTLDQFTRSVWAGTPRAYACDERARDLCLEGLENGHFDALENVWQKSAFKIPLEHCECVDPADHLANIDVAISIADGMIGQAPSHLRQAYESGARQPRLHRDVIARFGRHPHRNAILGRASTPEELDYIATGNFPHSIKLEIPPKGA
jgi:uncharacterized protein (DUF924 family)